MAPVRPSAKKRTRPPGPGAMLADAETQLAAGNVDAAITLTTRALDTTGPGGDFELRALNLLGVLHVETGDIDEARAFFERAVKLDPEGLVNEKVGGGPEKFLFLAQLSEEGGRDSLLWFERGAAALRKQAQSLYNLASRTPAQQADLEEKQQKLGGVLCAVAELYMTDLSWETDAEHRCEALITEATMVAPDAAETWQTVGNVRISQERVDEARTALARSLELWRDLPPEHPSVPAFPTRIALARLLLETDMCEEAMTVLGRLVADDDESVEAWYLGGWCLFMEGEKQQKQQQQRDSRPSGQGDQEGAAGGEEEEFKSTWVMARRWLARCLKLYGVLEYEDERLCEHATELVGKMNEVLGEMPEGEDEEWDEWDGSGEDDDEDEDGDGDEDEEMQD